jgi:5-formyltetrahydrofolate cyclo-ligase
VGYHRSSEVSVDEVKAALRRAARAARAELSRGERELASAAAVARLASLPELRPTHHVALYAASSDELDLAGLVEVLRRRRVETLFPRVRADDIELVRASDLRTLVLGYRGVAEPPGPAIDLEIVDAVLLPGVAFDPVGGRLGQGGGHYDRLLRRLPAHVLRIGVGFACQLVPRVPRAPHDEVVDLVVTDRAVYRTRARDEPAG